MGSGIPPDVIERHDHPAYHLTNSAMRSKPTKVATRSLISLYLRSNIHATFGVVSIEKRAVRDCEGILSGSSGI